MLGNPTQLAGALAVDVSGITQIVTGSFTPTGGAEVLIVVGTGGTSVSATGFTVSAEGFGVTWTKIDEVQYDNASDRFGAVAVFHARMPASPGSGTVTISWTNESIRTIIDAFEVSGTDETDPIPAAQVATGTGTGSTLAVNLAGSTPPDTSMAVGVVGAFDSPVADGVTPGTDFAEIQDEASGGPTVETTVQSEFDLDPADTTVDWSGLDSIAHGAIVFELVPAAASDIPPARSMPRASPRINTGSIR